MQSARIYSMVEANCSSFVLCDCMCCMIRMFGTWSCKLFTFNVRLLLFAQSNQYTTISDAINKLNFSQALYDENCFPLVCKVKISARLHELYILLGTLAF